MGHNRQVKHTAVTHNIPHQCRAVNELVAIRNGNHASFIHFTDFRNGCSFASHGHTAIRINIHRRLCFGFGNDVFHNGFIINHRLCIGFTGDGCKAAPCRTAGNSGNIFDVFKPRFTDITMHINKTRQYHMTVQIQFSCVFHMKILANIRNESAFDENIIQFFFGIRRCTEFTVFQNGFHARAPPICDRI